MKVLFLLVSVIVTLGAVSAIPPEWPRNIYMVDDTEYFLTSNGEWSSTDATTDDMFAIAETTLFELKKKDGAKKFYRLLKVSSARIKTGLRRKTTVPVTTTPPPTAQYLLHLAYDQSKCNKSNPKFFDPVVCPREYEEAHWPLDHVAYVTVMVTVDSKTYTTSLQAAFSRTLYK